jgi:DNA-binding NtrC family response regulator
VTTNISPLVLLLGCSEVGPPLRRLKLSARTVRGRKGLLSRARKFQARACLMHLQALDERELRDFIMQLRRELPFTDLLIWAPGASAEQIRRALVAGARDVVLSDSAEDAARAVAAVVRDQTIVPHLQRHEAGSRDEWRFEGLVSRSSKMWDIFDTIVQTAQTEATVLILGDTGTGKELVARAIHRRSGRSGHFVALNCGAVPESLLDSELFGHRRGAFTGAARDKQGLFRRASGGTLLLDEIGAIPVAAQYRLLRALQENAVRPVGADAEVAVDTRVIAATSKPLDEEVTSGTFREDLLYRLDVIRIAIPSLRERPEDILLLFDYFSRKLARQYRLKRPEVSGDFLDALLTHDWPGNVRQLENYTERLLLTAGQEKLTSHHFRALVKPFRGNGQSPGSPSPAGAAPGGARRDSRVPDDPPLDLRRPLGKVVEQTVECIERRYLEACLQANRGRIGETARQAGISRRTLLRKLNRYEIDKRAFR